MSKTQGTGPKWKPPEVGCIAKELPDKKVIEAAEIAVEENPVNRPNDLMMAQMFSQQSLNADEIISPMFLAVMTTKYWGAMGVDLSVSFMETTDKVLRDRILLHMNAWSEFCNVKFAWSQSQGDVRISRGKGGYWSYLGTDIRMISKNQPTMNLEGFVMNTPESEYKRVVRHETGHTLGYPHEHMRQELVNRLDPAKTIAYFKKYQGWDAQTTQQQVLTPLEESSLIGTEHADEDSIMCYALPAAITTDGKPILGGDDINDNDRAFAAKIYPPPGVPEPPTPPVVTRSKMIIEYEGVVRNPTVTLVPAAADRESEE